MAAPIPLPAPVMTPILGEWSAIDPPCLVMWKHVAMEYPPLPPDRWPDAPVRYPDPSVRSLDPRFDKYRVGAAVVERLYTGCRWAEGPVRVGDLRCLLWSDIPNDRMLRWTEETGEVSVFRQPSNNCNGNTRDLQGRLVTCEDGGGGASTEPNGAITVLADRVDGRPLNSPNDVVVDSDGMVWFTDPGYGMLSDYGGRRRLPTPVYRRDPERGVATITETSNVRMALLRARRDPPVCGRLRVDARGIHVYDVAGGRVANGRRFEDMGPGGADGIRCDADGNLWASAGWWRRVRRRACDRARRHVDRADRPARSAHNLCFGGAAGNRLFMTGSRSVYAVYLNATGASWPE